MDSVHRGRIYLNVRVSVLSPLVSPPGIMVRVVSGAVAFPFSGAGFLVEAVGITVEVSGINGGIATLDYLQRYGLGNKLM